MENMVKKIVDADNEAKAIENSLNKEKDELNRKIDDEVQAIYEKYMNKALEIIKKNDAAEEKLAEKQWKEIENKQKSAHIKLKSDFENNSNKWVNKLVEHVIS